jgi:hypothetical protein
VYLEEFISENFIRLLAAGGIEGGEIRDECGHVSCRGVNVDLSSFAGWRKEDLNLQLETQELL